MHRYKEWSKNLERLIEKVNFDIWMYKYIGMAGLRFLRFFLGILVYLFRHYNLPNFSYNNQKRTINTPKMDYQKPERVYQNT